ncbi:MAG: hypothetical protein Q7S16_04795 [bacterium]|nr:hypothetical protein [bacterium]
MDTIKLFQSKKFRMVLWIIGGVVLFLIVFSAGVAVGFKKANFSYRWGENYHKNFGGPRGGFFKDFDGRDLIDTNGVSGQIIKISGPALVIKGRDNKERIVLVNATTVIQRGKEAVSSADFSLDDFVVIIGEPNDVGQLEAKFIRIMPSPLQRRLKK